ncbi:TIM barrel protein [Paraburkholderia sp.]|uniref:sugar phosphate isomerase/epimerase family protein n=1 Tax=Paraburkholderia sp. TaxID=1926495 RepID=UPI0023845881|nr:TIM barrel protein [Paraburkholderia sp.]MDE1179034.1 TIM barrel protein [Paraburkholderia sp.]
MNSVTGVAHLTALELDSVSLVKAARRAGFGAVGLRVNPVARGALAYPDRTGTHAHRELRTVLRDEGVIVRDVEFIPIVAEIDVPSYAAMFDSASELGAKSVTVSGDDPDFGRLCAHYAALCDLGAQYGLRIDIEFMRWREVGNLQQACAVVAQADRSNGAILVDALHLARSGSQPDAIAALPPHWIRAMQLCDAPALAPVGDAATIAEAREGRLPPGTGSLPLRALLLHAPPECEVSVEMPYPALPADRRLALAFQSTQTLMTEKVG